MLKEKLQKRVFWLILQFFSSLVVSKSVAKHSSYVIVSNIKLPYAKLPKHLNSAVTNLFYPFSNEA